MSIEETYKGMWSSDTTLLKSLLDAGNTIMFAIYGGIPDHVARKRADGKYEWTKDGFSWDVFSIFYEMANTKFLIPPRPLVLEPKPLEWKHLEMNEEAIAVDGDWSFYAWHDGSWEIKYGGYMIDAELFMPDNSDFDTAKAAIHEWRVNHLKSMLP